MSGEICVQTGRRRRHHILACANLIDTDLETLMVTDRTPTGNLMLVRMFAKIGARQETTDTRSWIKVLAAEDADYIRGQALVKLVQHGILERRDGSFTWPSAAGTTPWIGERGDWSGLLARGATTRPSARSSCASATCGFPTTSPILAMSL